MTMTTQARLIAQKQAEALEAIAKSFWAMASGVPADICMSKAEELRAQAEAAQPTKEAAPGVDQTPVSDAEQSALYSFCGGTPHYDVARKLYRLAYAHVNQAAAQPEKEGETPRTDTLEEKFSPAFDGYVDFHGLMHEVREIEADLNQANAYAVALENENKNGAMLYACVANERDELALKLSAHHPDSGEWQAARSHQAQAVEGLVDRVPVSDQEQAALYAFCKGAPQYDTVRKLYCLAYRQVNATPPTQQEALAPQDRLSRHADIVLEAIQEYDAYMLEDDFNAQACLDKIIKRMRERFSASDATPSSQAVPEGFVLVPRAKEGGNG